MEIIFDQVSIKAQIRCEHVCKKWQKLIQERANYTEIKHDYMSLAENAAQWDPQLTKAFGGVDEIFSMPLYDIGNYYEDYLKIQQQKPIVRGFDKYGRAFFCFNVYKTELYPNN